jgi:predicted XRE-type DNA-binding protein
MGEYLNFKEKVEALASASPMDLGLIQPRVENATIEEDTVKNRLSIRRDIRAELAQAIQDNGLTQIQVARTLGIQNQNLSNFLRGRIPLPLKTVEEMLFLLDGIMTRV